MEAFGDLEDNAPDGGLQNPVDTGFGEGSNVFDDSQEWATHSSSRDIGGGPASTSTDPDQWGPEQPQQAAKKRRQRLIIRVTKIEHTRSDAIVWFDVQTSLPRFGRPMYRDVRRTHHELRRFADHLASANPECFVPALPPATNSWPAHSPEHDSTLLDNLQRWFDRVTRSPLLARDEEFLYFVESSFGYAPVVRIKPPATGWARKMIKQLAPPPDECTELRDFRPVAKLVYQFGLESHTRLAKVAKARRNLATALCDLSTKLGEATTTVYQPAVREALSRGAQVAGDVETRKAGVEQTAYGDGVEMVANDAFIIKETLTNRHILMRDLLKAQEESRDKHQRATRLKGATNISPVRVDEAITQLEDSAQLEKRITSAMRRVTDNLVAEKSVALGRMEVDLVGEIGQLTLRSIDAERRTLAMWESLRPEVRNSDGSGRLGLSRLGREVVMAPRNRHSQTLLGDDWSGDRIQRAADIAPPPQAAQEVMDAKTAASLLSGSLY